MSPSARETRPSSSQNSGVSQSEQRFGDAREKHTVWFQAGRQTINDPPNRNIKLGGRTAGIWCEVDVEDDGRGIPAEVVPTLYRCVRGPKTLNPAEPGSGC